jgi:hypothetical protein
MGSSAWAARVMQKLASLGILPADVPDPDEADEHWRNLRDYYGFYLNPKLSAAEVEAFEQRAGVRLPDDYRRFLTEIGNGGHGPGEGLEPLGMCMGREWPVERLRRPFPLEQPFYITEAWLRDSEGTEVRSTLLDGTLHLAHFGCGIRAVLVVRGTRFGEVWVDDLANDGGVMPALDHFLTRECAGAGPSFAAWYEGWLDHELVYWGRTPRAAAADRPSD